MVEQIPLIMGLISFLGGVVTWYGAAVKKNYAAERDFKQLKDCHANLRHDLGDFFKLMDQRLDNMEREHMRSTALVQALIVRLSGGVSQTFKQ